MAVISTSRIAIQANGNDAYAVIAQPDDDQQHPGIVMIQEWWGIESHVIDLAQKLAAKGFVVAVPDLYHGKVATEPNDAMRIMMLVRNNVNRAVQEIIGTLETVKAMPSVTPKKLGLLGFCLGGFLAYTVAARYPDLGAMVAFYGGGYDPTPEEVSHINAPVLAIYGRQDDSIPPEQIKKIEQLYKNAGKDLTVKIYDAGHAFINPNHGMGNEKAAAEAWPLAIQFLQKHLH